MKILLSLVLASTLAASAWATPHKTEAKPDDYPLTTCVVSGEKLGGMGEPYILHYKAEGQPDREVRFCCEMCVGRFNSNPERFLAKLDAAAAEANADAPAPADQPDHG